MASEFLSQVTVSLQQMHADVKYRIHDECLWLEIPAQTRGICFLSFEAMKRGVTPTDTFVFTEDVWMRNRNAVLSRIASRLGHTQRIHARQCTLERVPAARAKLYFNTHHLMGYATAYYHYALMHKGEAAAMMAFSKGRKMRRLPETHRSYELVRFCNTSFTTVVGGFSKLLQHFIREVDPGDIMTYIDTSWAEPDAYYKQGFHLDSQQKPNGFLIHTLTGERVMAPKPPDTMGAEWVYYENQGNSKLIKNCSHASV